MLKTKDVAGYLSPFSKLVKFLAAVSIPNEQNTLPAEVTAQHANELGIKSKSFTSISEGIQFVANQYTNCQVIIQTSKIHLMPITTLIQFGQERLLWLAPTTQ